MQREAVADVVKELLSHCVDVDAYSLFLSTVLEDGGDVLPYLEGVLDTPTAADVAAQLRQAFQAGKMVSSATWFDADDDFTCDDDYAAPAPLSEPPFAPAPEQPPVHAPAAPTVKQAPKQSAPGTGSRARLTRQQRAAAASAEGAALQAELLAGFSTASPPSQQQAAAGPSMPVCRFFVAGGCLMRDCTFSHDLGGVPCRYFLSPEGCSRADCTFWHPPFLSSDVYVPPAPPAEDQPVPAPPFPAPLPALDDEMPAFWSPPADAPPALSDDDGLGQWLLEWLQEHPDAAVNWTGGGDDDSAPAAGPSPPPLDTGDESLFPSLPQAAPHARRGQGPSALAQPPSKVGGAAGATDTEALAALLASKICFAPPTAGAFSGAQPRPVAPLHGSSGAALNVAHERIARGIAESLEWVDTGEGVAALYRELRAEAEAIAKARNLAFHRATRAFLAGHHTEASRMARQGRELQARMQRAHASAAGAIFEARNASASSGGSRSGAPLAAAAPGGGGLPAPTHVVLPPLHGGGAVDVRVFDLHGLHPSEAADVVEAVLGALATQRSSSLGGYSAATCWLAFLTGTRHHSRRLGKGGGSIQDAVLESLQRREGAGVEAFAPAAHGRSAASAAGVVVARVSAAR